MNRAEWATAFLGYAGWSVSQEKVVALVAQAAKEGSEALANPLDTTEGAPGATDYNSVGVKNYPSTEVGFGATLATFLNGYYPQLVANLSDPAGGSAVAYATNVELNTWGTGNCLQEVESIRGGDPHGYMTAEVAGTGGPSPPPVPPPPAPHRKEDLVTFGELTINGVACPAIFYGSQPSGTVTALVQTSAAGQFPVGTWEWFDMSNGAITTNGTPPEAAV